MVSDTSVVPKEAHMTTWTHLMIRHRYCAEPVSVGRSGVCGVPAYPI